MMARKKWLVAVPLILLLVVACVFFFIPAKLMVSRSSGVNCNAKGVSRLIGDPGNWGKWWPAGQGGKSAGSGLSAVPEYRIGRTLSGVTEVILRHGQAELPGWLTVQPHGGPDSSDIVWECTLESGLNPFQRIRQYRMAGAVSEQMNGMLDRFRLYLQKENAYGIPIRVGGTSDSFLVTTHGVFPEYPGTGDTYGLLKKLKGYITVEGAKQTGYPMMNVTQVTQHEFQLMVAIPIDKQIKPATDITPRKMVRGQFLESEVRGGIGTINQGFAQMQNYISDYQKATMAIPFQSLITDRLGEPDTSKWITRLYYPVY